MITIDLSPSQYRVIRSTVNSDSAVECSSTVSSEARASRMSQSQATAQATAPNANANAKAKAKPAKLTLPDTHPIYGIVNLALLSVTLYLLWANL